MIKTQLASSVGTSSKENRLSDCEGVEWDAVTKTLCRIIAFLTEDRYYNGEPPWAVVTLIFQEKTGFLWTVKELRRKWRLLRRLFTMCKPVIGNASGIGWNPQTGTITADEDWWHEQIKANPDVAALKYIKMPPWSVLQTMFDPANDKLKQGLSSSQCNVQHVSSERAERSSTLKRSHDHGPAAQENPTPNFQSPESEQATRKVARQAAATQQSQPVKVPSVFNSLEQPLQPGNVTKCSKSPLDGQSTAQNLAAPFGPSLTPPPAIENYALNEGHQLSEGEHVHSSQNADMRQEILQAPKRAQDFSEERSATSHAHKSGTSIGTCMDIVRSLPGVTERDPFYIDTLMLISRDVEMREALVVGVRQPEARMAYLRRQVERARKNGSL